MQTPCRKAGTPYQLLALDQGSAGRQAPPDSQTEETPLPVRSGGHALGSRHRAGGPEAWMVGAGVQLDPSRREETGMTSMTCLSHPS